MELDELVRDHDLTPANRSAREQRLAAFEHAVLGAPALPAAAAALVAAQQTQKAVMAFFIA
jgi:hypothetical protein